jgi:iron-sulfur cluster assembly accessory protein
MTTDVSSTSQPNQAQTQDAQHYEIVEITDSALSQFKQILSKDPQMIGIRLGVVGGGCAGLSYHLAPCDAELDGDLIQEQEGVRFYVHPMAAAYLKGTKLDYSDSMMDGGFKFINPNASSTCGCGSSFGI